MKYDLPQSVKVCLWSYDTDKIDLSMPDHRLLIIKNILNTGTTPAILWLFDNFTREEISSVIEHSNVSEWNKKSLSLWSLVFGIYPLKQTRFA
jgi:hypothetical protein